MPIMVVGVTSDGEVMNMMNMKTMSAKDAEASFSQFIEAAQLEPIVVTREDRPIGVFLSIDHLEDIVWGEKAKAAHAEGYLTVEESAAILNAEPPWFRQRIFEPIRGFFGALR